MININNNVHDQNIELVRKALHTYQPFITAMHTLANKNNINESSTVQIHANLTFSYEISLVLKLMNVTDRIPSEYHTGVYLDHIVERLLGGAISYTVLTEAAHKHISNESVKYSIFSMTEIKPMINAYLSLKMMQVIDADIMIVKYDDKVSVNILGPYSVVGTLDMLEVFSELLVKNVTSVSIEPSSTRETYVKLTYEELKE